MSISVFELIKLYFSYAVIAASIGSMIWREMKTMPFSLTAIGSQSIIKDFLILLIVSLSLIIHSSFGESSLGIFMLFYTVAPLAVSIAFLYDGINEISLGFVTVAKGLYYALLVIVSTLQYVYSNNDDLGRLALGFTLSIAVFESVMGILDGTMRIMKEDEGG